MYSINGAVTIWSTYALQVFSILVSLLYFSTLLNIALESDFFKAAYVSLPFF